MALVAVAGAALTYAAVQSSPPPGPGNSDPSGDRSLAGAEPAAAESSATSEGALPTRESSTSARTAPPPEEQGSASPSDDSSEPGDDSSSEDPVPPLPEDYTPLAEGALDFPTMKELDPTDPSYDAKIEAQQTFHPMEQTLLAADPLDPSAWRKALEQHRLRNAGIAKRAQFLQKSGHPGEAEDLIMEWNRVYGTWQARAYGRSGPPGSTR